MTPDAPPFQVTSKMIALAAEIERLIGRAEGLEGRGAQPLLRKQNRVRTIRGSVGIEGNTLTEEQITAILAGKRVIGARREILEVTNANDAYERARQWRADREKDLLAAHRILMTGLTEPAGAYRRTNVGVLDGTRVAHVAPPARRVPGSMQALLSWIRSTDMPALIRSCVAHYEILFIHPFTDGNGRIARLWQHVILLESAPLFEIVPMESVIRERQKTYYDVLGRCDRRGDSTEFVELALVALRDALMDTLVDLRPARATSATRLAAARRSLGRKWFRRADYLRLHPSISTATASRDLHAGIDDGALDQRGERRLTEYRFR